MSIKHTALKHCSQHGRPTVHAAVEHKGTTYSFCLLCFLEKSKRQPGPVGSEPPRDSDLAAPRTQEQCAGAPRGARDTCVVRKKAAPLYKSRRS